MKIDYHSHILPGLDDGARDIEDAVMLAEAMHGWGFERITCTPHINALYRNTPETIRPAFEELQEALYATGNGPELKMSAEYRIVPETWPEVLRKEWLMPIEGKYILTELPISKPQEMGNLKPLEEFRKLTAMGLIPILPHPERYFYLSRQELMSYIDAGVIIQCNYGSFAGLYGQESQKIAQELRDAGLVSLYGTDMHNAHYVKVMGDWFAAGNAIME
jgi:tyrosine-protein phosphatase YwqE